MPDYLEIGTIIAIFGLSAQIFRSRKIRIYEFYEKKPVITFKRSFHKKDNVVIKIKNIGGVAYQVKPIYLQTGSNKTNFFEGKEVPYIKPFRKKKFKIDFPYDYRFQGCCLNEYRIRFRDTFGNKYEASTHQAAGFFGGILEVPLSIKKVKKFENLKDKYGDPINYSKEHEQFN